MESDRRRLRIVSAAALGLAALAAACASPLWRFDHYVLEGTLAGKRCQMTLGSRAVTWDTVVAGADLLVQRDFMYEPTLPRGMGVKMLRCRGLVVLIVSPAGALPPTGRYRLVPGSVSVAPGTATMNVFNGGIGPGLWPLALMGVSLQAKEGYLQLDQVSDSVARGTFHAVLRRQPDGEG